METNSFFSLQISLDATNEDVQAAVAKLLAAFGLNTATAAAAPAPQITPQQIAQDQDQDQGQASGAAELDAAGIPWDERIHAGTKTKTAKKLWTRKKGVDDALYDAVVASYKGTAPAAAAAAPATTPAVTAPAVATTPAITVPTLAPAAPLTGYAELVDFLAKNSGDGKLLTNDIVTNVFTHNNTTLAALAGQDDMATQFTAAFRNILRENNVAEVK